VSVSERRAPSLIASCQIAGGDTAVRSTASRPAQPWAVMPEAAGAPGMGVNVPTAPRAVGCRRTVQVWPNTSRARKRQTPFRLM
jgi:hypothetical protein